MILKKGDTIKSLSNIGNSVDGAEILSVNGDDVLCYQQDDEYAYSLHLLLEGIEKKQITIVPSKITNWKARIK